MHRPLFLERFDSACDWLAQLKTQSAQREDVFLNALHVDWRQHFVNRPLCGTMTESTSAKTGFQ
jgi:hypothetical protein